MAAFTFTAVLTRPEGTGTWTYVDIPFDVAETFGKKGQVKVRGTVNGCPYRGSALPHGDGRHYLVVAKPIRDAIGASQGDTVQVVMEADLDARSVALPPDFQAALDGDEIARAAFEQLAYTHRKVFVDWIESAKKVETRSGRVAKAVAMVKAGQKLKG